MAGATVALAVLIVAAALWPAADAHAPAASRLGLVEAGDRRSWPHVGDERAAPERATRPNYRYSVIAHGAYTTEELSAAMVRDPVVAAEYGDLRLGDLRVETVDAPRLAYMSYRVGDRIYWTKHAVPLQVGEAILSDGVMEIRARCGNGISDMPVAATFDDEPDRIEFDRLVEAAPVGPSIDTFADPLLDAPQPDLDPLLAAVFRTVPIGGTPFPGGLTGALGWPATGWPDPGLTPPGIAVPATPPLPAPGDPWLLDPPGGSDWPPFSDPPVVVTTTDPVAVPEPGTLTLLMIGAGSLLLRHRRRTHRPGRWEPQCTAGGRHRLPG